MSNKLKIRTKKPFIAYPGTVIQQNYAESLSHGFLLWDIDERSRFDVSFHELPNSNPYVTLDWNGNTSDIIDVARSYPEGSRFRIRSTNLLTQKDLVDITSELQQSLKATEVTFKNDQQVNNDVIMTGVATLVKDDLRSPDVLLSLLKDYYDGQQNITDNEWNVVREQVVTYLAGCVGKDDDVRNTKWSLRHVQFDNTFNYGKGNEISFDKLPGIVGIFGQNRAGKSSIIGTIMYSLFNMTDRGNIKNLYVVNARHPYCYTRAIVNVAGVDYVIERQTTKHEKRTGQVNANTSLNVFRMNENGEAIDLVGEERKDTERTIRRLIGTGDDCLLTSVATQDDVKQYINQGSTKRRQHLSRFLDLDIFDQMHSLAKDDVNVSKLALRSVPDRDWSKLETTFRQRLITCADSIRDNDYERHGISMMLDSLKHELLSFSDIVPVTEIQREHEENRIVSLSNKLNVVIKNIGKTKSDIEKNDGKVSSIERLLNDNDPAELKRRLDAYRAIESSVESLKLVHERDETLLAQQERSLKILDDVPCGDSFPTCRFIKDAHKNKERIGPQRERVNDALEKLNVVIKSFDELKREDLLGKVQKLEQLIELRNRLRLDTSMKNTELVKLETQKLELETFIVSSKQRLVEITEALKNEENLEVVTLRHSIDEASRSFKKLESESMSLATEMGRVQLELDKLMIDAKNRSDLLQTMRAHELIMQAFSKKGIPSMIVASQLPIINAEITKILQGIVDFNVELVLDDETGDSLEIYINYGDSRRPIELGSGMEKTIASIALRVALINVSSLPKPDFFVLDEIGNLDAAQVEACNRLLVSLKHYFRTIILITHVDGAKDIADHVIEITRDEKDSRVTYNESWRGDRT